MKNRFFLLVCSNFLHQNEFKSQLQGDILNPHEKAHRTMPKLV